MNYNPGDITIVGRRALHANAMKPAIFKVGFSSRTYHAVVVETKKGRSLGIDATTPQDCFPNRLFVDEDYDAPYSRGFVCDAVRITKNGSVTFYMLMKDHLEVMGTYAVGTEFVVHNITGRIDPETCVVDLDTVQDETFTPRNNMKEDE